MRKGDDYKKKNTTPIIGLIDRLKHEILMGMQKADKEEQQAQKDYEEMMEV